MEDREIPPKDTAFEDRVRALKSQTSEKQVHRFASCTAVCPEIEICSLELCPPTFGSCAALFLLLGLMAVCLPKGGACCECSGRFEGLKCDAFCSRTEQHACPNGAACLP